MENKRKAESKRDVAVFMESMKDWGVRMSIHDGLFEVDKEGHVKVLLYLAKVSIGIEDAIRWQNDSTLSEELLWYENKGTLEDLVATAVAISMYYVFTNDKATIEIAHNAAKGMQFYEGGAVVHYTENGYGWSREKWANLFLEKSGFLRSVNSSELASMWLFDMIITGLTAKRF